MIVYNNSHIIMTIVIGRVNKDVQIILEGIQCATALLGCGKNNMIGGRKMIMLYEI